MTCGEGGGGAVGNGGGYLANRFGSAIACHEYSSVTSLGYTAFVRSDVAVGIENHLVLKGLILGCLTDADEHSVHLELVSFAVLVVIDLDRGKTLVAEELLHHRGINYFHVGALCKNVAQLFLAGKVGEILHDIHLFASIGEFPPPITATVCPLKNAPSQTAQ